MTSHRDRAVAIAEQIALDAAMAHLHVEIEVQDTIHDCALINVSFGGDGFLVEVSARTDDVHVLDPSDVDMSVTDLSRYVITRASIAGQP
ncbi:MAG: hypothetical protein BGO26_19685 [Actinobacteria bacterium 69-20]|nr:hypothetical protein [Actinomycetota bacterium]OJV24750.1 MAG: hypothetical protein BGO26_19685 [Actinobacteria bacterium 69-20]